MQDAAVVVKDSSCELRCRLVALKWLLPPIPSHVADLDAHGAPASGPPPTALTDLQRPFRSIAVQVGPCWGHHTGHWLADAVGLHCILVGLSRLSNAIMQTAPPPRPQCYLPRV